MAVPWSEGEVRIARAAKASVPFAPAFDQPVPLGVWACGPGPPERSATTLVLLTTDATVEAGFSTACSAGRWPAPSSGSWSTSPGMPNAAVLLANATAAAPTLRAAATGRGVRGRPDPAVRVLAEGLALRVPGARKLVVVTVTGPPTTPTLWLRPERSPGRWP